MAEGAPGSLGKSAEGRSQMESPAVAEGPYGSTDPAPLLADAELGQNVGSAMSLHDSPAVDAVETVVEPPRHRQADHGR